MWLFGPFFIPLAELLHLIQVGGEHWFSSVSSSFYRCLIGPELGHSCGFLLVCFRCLV